MHHPIRVAVTGAAGQIGYSLLFRIAAGEMLGKDQPVILQLLDIPQLLPSLKGVVMELEDCAFPLLADVTMTDDPKVAFRDAGIAMLVGARPRSKGMERKDLLEANGVIFSAQGRALDEAARRDVKDSDSGQSRQYQRLHRHEKCAGAEARQFFRDDAAGPQPRLVAGSRSRSGGPFRL